MIDRDRVQPGMVVRSSDGRRLGQVLACQEGGFVVVKGLLFRMDYVARYDEVVEISGREIRLSVSRDIGILGRFSGLDESLALALGLGGELDAPPMEPWAEGDEEGSEKARVGELGAEAGIRDAPAEAPGAYPPSYGDEGGGGASRR